MHTYSFDFLLTGTLIPYTQISGADFSNSGTTGLIFPNLDAGTVSMNGSIFKKFEFGTVITYADTTYNSYTSPYIWNVSGSSSAPAINHTITSTSPTYTGYSSLQDTVTKSQNTTILINGVNGADELQVFISSQTSQQTQIKLLPGNAASVTFNSGELSGLGTTTNGYIDIIAYKNFIDNFGGKKYKFQIGYRLEKYVYLKP